MDVSEGFEETFKCVRGVLFAILNVIGNYYVFHSDQLIAVLYILGVVFFFNQMLHFAQQRATYKEKM